MKVSGNRFFPDSRNAACVGGVSSLDEEENVLYIGKRAKLEAWQRNQNVEKVMPISSTQEQPDREGP